MPRPKRPARKQRLTELTIRKLHPGPKDLSGLGQPAARAGAQGAADRGDEPGRRSTRARAGRAGCTWATPARSDWPTPAQLAAEAMLGVARGNDPAAEKRAERGAGTFADLAGRYVELHAKKRNKSWRQADTLVRALPAAALGQAAGDLDQPRRRQGDDGAYRGTRRRQPDAGGGVGDLQLGVEGGDRRRQPMPRRRPQRDSKPRARAVRFGGPAILGRLR